jgi:hypothetical protein
MLLKKTLIAAMIALAVPSTAHARHGEDDRSGDDRGRGRGGESDSLGRGDEQKAKKPPRPVRLRDRLSLVDGVVSSASGISDFRSEVKKKHTHSRFRIQVKIPLPSAIPAVANEAEARALPMSGTLSRDGVAYAICSLQFDQIDEQFEEEDDGVPTALTAHFRADMESTVKGSKTRLKRRRGSCDIDLATEGVQKGVPAVADGDTVVVTHGLLDSALLEGEY